MITFQIKKERIKFKKRFTENSITLEEYIQALSGHTNITN